MTAPVAFICFNRPDVTRRTLEQIEKAKPSELYVIADGPRQGNPDDPSGCEAVRKEIERVPWACRVHRLYSEVNLGLEANTILGLDWVFGQVEEAVIVEDDCLPNADFFRFCTELLARYRDTGKVWHISGLAPTVPLELFGGASYAFTAFGLTWGWATWRDRWQSFRAGFRRGYDNGSARSPSAAGIDSSQLLTRSGRRFFQDVARDIEAATFTWDVNWAQTVIANRGLAVMPAANLIENIGYGPDATNTRGELRQRGHESMRWPLAHPPELAVNAAIQRSFEGLIAPYYGRIERFFASRLREGRARDLARSAARIWRERRMPLELE
jgi:hypothetical protein